MGNKHSIKSIHSDKLKLLYNKALSSQKTNDDQQALSYYTQALHEIQSTDNTSQDIYQIQHNIFLHICDIYIRQYNITLAKKFINKALQVAEELQEQDKISECLGRRGEIKRLEGDYDAALLDHNKSVEIKLKIDKNKGFNASNSYFNIGNVYNDQGKYADAVVMYEKSLKIELLALGENYPSIATTYHNIGNAYKNQGKYDDAVSMYEKSLKIKLIVLGDNHPSIATTYNNIGSVYNDQGKYDDAVTMYERSLKIKLSTLGHNHPSIATTYNNIGSIYNHQGKYDDAILFYERAVAILVDANLQNHPNLVTLYSNIAFCYDKQNRPDDAKKMRKKSNDVRSSLGQVDTMNQLSTNVINPSQGIRNIYIFDFLTS